MWLINICLRLLSVTLFACDCGDYSLSLFVCLSISSAVLNSSTYLCLAAGPSFAPDYRSQRTVSFVQPTVRFPSSSKENALSNAYLPIRGEAPHIFTKVAHTATNYFSLFYRCKRQTSPRNLASPGFLTMPEAFRFRCTHGNA